VILTVLKASGYQERFPIYHHEQRFADQQRADQAIQWINHNATNMWPPTPTDIKLLEFLGLQPGDIVADFGCGYGNLSAAMAKKVDIRDRRFRVFGYDWIATMIQAASLNVSRLHNSGFISYTARPVFIPIDVTDSTANSVIR
jgi:16S rRNA G1207 methylase RsmC